MPSIRIAAGDATQACQHGRQPPPSATSPCPHRWPCAHPCPSWWCRQQCAPPAAGRARRAAAAAAAAATAATAATAGGESSNDADGNEGESESETSKEEEEGEEGPMPPEPVELDDCIQVYWEAPKKWYKGDVVEMQEDVGRRWAVLIRYRDGSELYHTLDGGPG
eukprot:scaffold11348_cov123-Isochrysis_galbana.AAC.2